MAALSPKYFAVLDGVIMKLIINVKKNIQYIYSGGRIFKFNDKNEIFIKQSLRLILIN